MIPPVIFSEDVLVHKNKTYWDETLSIIEGNGEYTTKGPQGELPYLFLCTLINGSHLFLCTDPQTGRKLDIYIPHIQYMKKTNYLHLEMSIMFKNRNSTIWQASGHAPRNNHRKK